MLKFYFKIKIRNKKKIPIRKITKLMRILIINNFYRTKEGLFKNCRWKMKEN